MLSFSLTDCEFFINNKSLYSLSDLFLFIIILNNGLEPSWKRIKEKSILSKEIFYIDY